MNKKPPLRAIGITTLNLPKAMLAKINAKKIHEYEPSWQVIQRVCPELRITLSRKKKHGITGKQTPVSTNLITPLGKTRAGKVALSGSTAAKKLRAKTTSIPLTSSRDNKRGLVIAGSIPAGGLGAIK